MAKKILWTMIALIVLYIGLFYGYNYFFSRSLVVSPLKPNQIQSCQGVHPKNISSTVRVLIVDGGGIDGIMPLVLLDYLEKKTGKPINQLFDFFTGTSTGSIIVSSLNLATSTGQTKFSAEKILELYQTVSKVVLNPTLARAIFSFDGYFAPILSTQILNEGFKKLIGTQVTFGELIKDVAITTYNITDKRISLLNSWDCDQPISRYRVADLLSAATATPIFFSPVILSEYPKNHPTTMMDGMIFANNPSLTAVIEAFHLYPHAKRFMIVHLGTGGNSLDFLHLPESKIAKWGIVGWAFPMMTILYKSQNILIREAINSIQHFSPTTQFSYYYFSKALEPALPFDTSDENMQYIENVAGQLLNENKDRLDKLAAELVAAGKNLQSS